MCGGGECGGDATEAALDQAGEILARFNGRLYPRLVEVTTDQVWLPTLTAVGVGPEKRDAAVAAFFSTVLTRRLLYPDTLPFLQELAVRNIPVGILTDVPYGMPRSVAARMLEGIEEHCPLWITSVEVGYCKPDPRGLLALAERMGVSPGEMTYVGNEEKDVLAAQAAGMLPIRIDRAGELPRLSEYPHISQLSEVLTLLG